MAAELMQLFFARREAVRQYFERSVRNPRDLDDLVQEVYLRLLRTSPDPQEVRDVGAYLFGIAHNVYADWCERAVKQRGNVSLDSALSQNDDEILEQLSVPDVADVARVVTLERIAAEIYALPPMHREVFLLVKRDGFSHEKAAAHLGISRHTVRKYLDKAMATLRKRLCAR